MEAVFYSRYIIRSDFSYNRIWLGKGKIFDFAEHQKPQEGSWHSRSYEYAFVRQGMFMAYRFRLIKLNNVLDLACGTYHPGYISLANNLEIKKVFALDCDSRLMDNGMEHPKVFKIVANAAYTLTRGNYFDAIACVSALEHMDNWTAVTKEMHRILKPGGMAFVTLDISTDPEKTKQHNVDGKVPDDYREAFEEAGLPVYGNYDSKMPDDAVDTICSKYPLCKDESQFKPGQHRALKAFKMVLRKEK